MLKQKPITPNSLARRIQSVQKIYSQIGQPLPAPIIVDLYLHLPKIPQISPKPTKKS